ncbi:protein kinase domain-containing protein [Halorientalis halophila]|uniref:protein kinase domain-containing protein n=1 Tax=Halorientalis halophila TaxID=3108499 RepID=UPI0030092221
MSSPDEDGASAGQAVFRAVLSDPADGRSHVPSLLGALDAEDRETRLSAAWALTLVATADPDTVEAISRRLADRLVVDADRPETRHAIEYLRERYPDRVDAVLAEQAAEADERARRRRYLNLSHGFARSDYVTGSDRNRDVGRTKTPGSAGSGDPRNVYAESGDPIDGPPEETRGDDARDRLDGAGDEDAADGDDETTDESGDGTVDGNEDGTAEAAGEASAGSNADEEPASPAAQRRRQEAELASVAAAVDLDAIAAASRFDDLQVVSTGVQGRFTTVYRTRATLDGSEDGVALRLFEAPDDSDGFEADVTASLRDWASVSDHEGVVTLYDWGTEPSLWMLTAFTADSLYDRIDLSIDEGIWNGVRVAEAVAAIHQRGVVHAGLDPYSVVYSGSTVADRDRPLVTNVGLLSAMRSYVDPASLLDPRFAAPEYYDRGFGDVGHATDVYQLGAVVYYLVTGRPPFQGTYAEVRTAVLESTPPPPSSINPEIPTWIDEVVRTAMAKQKLTRYETATLVARELERGGGA